MAKDDIVDAEEGAPSTDTFATGIVIFTTIALVVGFLIIQMAVTGVLTGVGKNELVVSMSVRATGDVPIA